MRHFPIPFDTFEVSLLTPKQVSKYETFVEKSCVNNSFAEQNAKTRLKVALPHSHTTLKQSTIRKAHIFK
jgi:hypothetical protein